MADEGTAGYVTKAATNVAENVLRLWLLLGNHDRRSKIAPRGNPACRHQRRSPATFSLSNSRAISAPNKIDVLAARRPPPAALGHGP